MTMPRFCSQRSLALLTTALGFLFLVGCGGKDSGSQSEVTGSVMFEGKPLPGAEIQFVPQGSGGARVHNVTTDEQGKYTLKSGPSDPLEPGDYVVLVRKIATGGNDPSKPGGGMGAVTNEVPAAYADRAKSPFKVELKSGAQTLQPFEVKRDRHS